MLGQCASQEQRHAQDRILEAIKTSDMGVLASIPVYVMWWFAYWVDGYVRWCAGRATARLAWRTSSCRHCTASLYENVFSITYLTSHNYLFGSAQARSGSVDELIGLVQYSVTAAVQGVLCCILPFT